MENDKAEQVMIDYHLASFYGVETKVLNQNNKTPGTAGR